MTFEPTGLDGLFLIKPDIHADSRGRFARLWCAETFASAGVAFIPRQMSTSGNRLRGTLRGLHWQTPPHAETKLICATRGRAWDVAVDMRANSPTRFAWFGIELDAENRLAMLIPAGFAHGFVTLTEDTELLYCIDVDYCPEASRGARFDDRAIGITWPREPAVIAARDLEWPALCPVTA